MQRSQLRLLFGASWMLLLFLILLALCAFAVFLWEMADRAR